MEAGKYSAFTKFNLVNYKKYNEWAIILAVVLNLNGLNYYVNKQVERFRDPSITVFEDLNSLIRG